MQSKHQGGSRRSTRRLMWIALGAVGLALVPAAPIVAGSDLTSEEVADEIARIQLKADDAAAALEHAEFAAEGLAEDLAAAQQDVVEARAEVDALETTLANVAVRRYMNAGDTGPIILNSDPMTHVQSEVLSQVA